MENIILIGCGPHAKRVYLPALRKNKNAKVSLIVELNGQERSVKETIREDGKTETLFIKKFKGKMPEELKTLLKAHIEEHKVKGVIR